MSADPHRSAVYAAEDHLRGLLSRGGTIDFHGSLLDVPIERRFGDIDGVQRYLAAIREHPWGHSDIPAPQVVASRATTRATWTEPDTIAIPQQQDWAMRESVALHEYAHHVQFHRTGTTRHDRDFCQLLLDLIDNAMGPTTALLLRAGFTDGGVFPLSQH